MVAEWLLPEFNTEIVDEWFAPEMRYHNRVPPARYSLRSPLGDEYRHAAAFHRGGSGRVERAVLCDLQQRRTSDAVSPSAT